MKKILIIEDDDTIRVAVKILLENKEYLVETAANGTEGIQKYDESFSLIILDIMMPDISGIDVCKILRQKSNVPILFLSAKSEEIDKYDGLSSGADDYLTKPFSSVELIARVQALLRRYYEYDNNQTINLTSVDSTSPQWIERCGIKVCTVQNNVRVNDININLTDKEYKIILLLVSYPTKCFSAENIFESVWGEPYLNSSKNNVVVHMKNLRNKIRKISPTSKVINTVWGEGYRFE